eukprot:9494297-Pyramimonas_sp.AAC.1
MGPQEIADNRSNRASDAAAIRTLRDTPPRIIIAREETKRQFTQAKQGSSGGPDNLIDDYCKIAPKEMARICHPLLGKAQLATVEQISRKGGWQAFFFMPNATKPDLHARWLILFNSVVAKHRHCFLRSRLKNVTAQLLSDAQCGSRPHQSTDFATHATLGIMEYLGERGKSAMVIFWGSRAPFTA